MRVVVTLITVLFAAPIVCAQTPTMSQPPDLQVIKYSWSKDRIAWDKNPFGRRTEISDVRSRRSLSRSCRSTPSASSCCRTAMGGNRL